MKRFRKIYIEITNICNMHCSFCPETTRAKTFMSVEQFEHIAKQIEPYTDYVYLHVKGEPLIHEQLKDIFNICNKYRLKINISTNGILLNNKKEIIKDANIRQLNVSLHSFEKQDEIKLHNYLTNVLDVADYLNKAGVIVRYKLWNDDTISNNQKIIQTLEQRYNVDIHSVVYNKDIKLKESMFLSIKQPFEWPDIQADNKQETTCYGLRNQIAILVDGTVVPCCVDNNGEINLGNIFNTSLEEILQTDIAKKIKTGFENNKCEHKLCKKCGYRTYVT